jgi:hypothetical protein
MTDRVKGLTVILEHDMRIDDAEYILKAISMIKGVVEVHPKINNPSDFIARGRLKSELREKFYKFLNDNLM